MRSIDRDYSLEASFAQPAAAMDRVDRAHAGEAQRRARDVLPPPVVGADVFDDLLREGGDGYNADLHNTGR